MYGFSEAITVTMICLAVQGKLKQFATDIYIFFLRWWEGDRVCEARHFSWKSYAVQTQTKLSSKQRFHFAFSWEADGFLVCRCCFHFLDAHVWFRHSIMRHSRKYSELQSVTVRWKRSMRRSAPCSVKIQKWLNRQTSSKPSSTSLLTIR